MVATARTLGPQFARCGWTLVRTPVNAASGWHRWHVSAARFADAFCFHRIDEVEVFWRGCFHARLTATERVRALARWHSDEPETRALIDAWLAGGDARVPEALRARVRVIPAPPAPRHWRTVAQNAGPLPPPRGIDLRDDVRRALTRQD